MMGVWLPGDVASEGDRKCGARSQFGEGNLRVPAGGVCRTFPGQELDKGGDLALGALGGGGGSHPGGYLVSGSG